jgi:lysozyme family protein
MADFEKAIAKTFNLEGSYSNNKYDTGGKTMYGITEAVARAHGFKGDMKNLSLGFAKSIYKLSYWDANRLTEVSSQLLAENIFDAGVNCGIGMAGLFLQRALNLLNRRGTLWPDIAVDGKIGTCTINTLKKALTVSGMKTGLVKLYNVLRGAYYVQIAEKRIENEEFMLGWILHRVMLEVK